MDNPSSPKKRPKAKTIPQSEWKNHRKRINQLYIDQGKPLDKVMAVLQKETGFAANKAQYKTQISSWKLRKNETSKEVESQDEIDEPTEEQQRRWASRGKALLCCSDLGDFESRFRLVFTSVAYQMLQEGSFDFNVYLSEIRSTSKIEVVKPTSDSALAFIMEFLCCDLWTWSFIFYYVKEIAGNIDVKTLRRECRNPSGHECCPNPTHWESQYAPPCEELLTPPVLILLTAALLAEERFQKFDASSYRRQFAFTLRDNFDTFEDWFPTAMKHANKLKIRIDKTAVMETALTPYIVYAFRSEVSERIYNLTCQLSLVLEPNDN